MNPTTADRILEVFPFCKDIPGLVEDLTPQGTVFVTGTDEHSLAVQPYFTALARWMNPTK